jgi:catechol-2,3-dioxygenase
MRIQKLRLECHDLASAQAFYGELLGLPFVANTPDSISFRTGESELVFCLSATNPAEYHFAWNIPANQIESSRDFLIRIAPHSTDGEIHTFASWNAQAIYFRDPFGNIAEFISRNDLGNASDHPFNVHDLLELSEIGIVASNVRSTVDRLLQTFDLDLYRTTDRSDDFQAIGGDHGLFIVVREGRPWFASSLTSQAAPIEVAISGAKLGRFINPDAALTVLCQ